MKRWILLLTLLLSGCSRITLQTYMEDPVTKTMLPCHISRTALFMSLNNVSAHACGASIKASQASPNSESIGVAVAAGIKAAGMLK